MKLQQIFNKVAAHLMKQKQKSLGLYKGTPYEAQPTLGCAYRGADGLRCAVGCLIPNRVYHKKMEGMCASDVIDGTEGLEHLVPHTCSINELQQLHDTFKPSKWRTELRKFAKSEGLELPECLQ